LEHAAHVFISMCHIAFWMYLHIFLPKTTLWMWPRLFVIALIFWLKFHLQNSQILSFPLHTSIPLHFKLSSSHFKFLPCLDTCSQQHDTVRPFKIQDCIIPVFPCWNKCSAFHQNPFFFLFFFFRLSRCLQNIKFSVQLKRTINKIT
jgi:hypothetical protein